ncbi:MAG: cell envelope biogenesis protein OmpA [Rhodobacterales bacterium]|nr:MAG: cell envelope biogenesis protein OmpA [Rhodobacterales bacterium]
MRLICAALLFFLSWVGPAMAQDVVLTSRDGKVSIAGTLLSFDGEFYRLKSAYGAMTLEKTAVSCAGTGCPDLENYVAEITLAGARAIGQQLMPALLADFARQSGFELRQIIRDDLHFSYELRSPDAGKPVARFHFALSNTADGFARLIKGEANMVLASRAVTDKEIIAARKAGLGHLREARRQRIVGLDAVVALVAPNNPLGAISQADLARLFAGEISNWQQIGGPNAPVYLHLPAASLGIAQRFQQDVMEANQLELAADIARHQDAAALADTVAADPFAIGISRLSEIGNAKILRFRSDCGIGLQASARSVKTEDYPLTAPLFLYLPAYRLPKIGREFLSYLQDPSAQHVVRAAGFVDQRVEEIALTDQGARFAHAIAAAGPETDLAELQRMVTRLQTGKRLSLTFRFQPGSSRLDAQSKANVVLLARLLEAGRYDGRELLFVGFSDGKGPAKVNRKIAQKRAAAVRAAVQKAAKTLRPQQLSLQLAAFGEAMPMACDDSPWGRQVNRRVEVWVKERL